MLLMKKELVVCLFARGYEDVRGFENVEPDFSQQEQESIRKRLLDQELMEKADSGESGYRFSPLGQVILDTVGAPDVWLELRNTHTGISRKLYLRDAYYICIDEDGDLLRINLLLSLPMMIGGYASALEGLKCDEPLEQEQLQDIWEDADPFIRIAGGCGDRSIRIEIGENGVARKKIGDDVAFEQFTEESCTNTITMWMLSSLKERGGNTDE